MSILLDVSNQLFSVTEHFRSNSQGSGKALGAADCTTTRERPMGTSPRADFQERDGNDRKGTCQKRGKARTTANETIEIALISSGCVLFSDLVDTLAGTMEDTYDDKQFVAIADYFMCKGTQSGLKYIADHVLGEAMVQRGHDKRLVCLHHMFSKVLMHHGNPIETMVIMSKGGKTNKVTRNIFAHELLSHD